MNRRKNNLFKEVPVARVNRNMFDLSHEVKMSCKFGNLYPVLLMDTLPGDTVRDQMTCFARFAPMLAPIMHLIDISTHFFFVPNRLVTDHWETFITGGQDGTDAVVLPYVTADGLDNALNATPFSKGSLWDYLGLPPSPTVPPATLSLEQISALPFWVYVKIWNDFYRDPNIDDEVVMSTELEGDVSDEVAAQVFNSAGQPDHTGLRQRGWERDYFTGALPWAQRGAQVLMPLGGTGSVTYTPTSNYYQADGGDPAAGAASFGAANSLRDSTNELTRVENIDEVTLDSSSITINDFRRTMAIQRWLENNARGGGRYIEQIESHFGMRVPDFRLQRAEYLGGGKQQVIVSEVLATAESDDIPVGDMAGHGISVGKSNRFTYRCQEHGWIMGIMSIMPKSAYSQGIEKMWSRTDKYEYAWPELANLGEQQILSKELFFDMDAAGQAANQTVFGYIPRYAEYKFRNDRIAGDFRTTLGFWHLSRFFTERPTLDHNFLAMNENGAGVEETFRRIFAVQDGTDYVWLQLFHRLTAKRPLPYFGVPNIT